MHGQFPCPECGQPILIMVHRKGDVARCMSCGVKAEVPEQLEGVPLIGLEDAPSFRAVPAQEWGPPPSSPMATPLPPPPMPTDTDRPPTAAPVKPNLDSPVVGRVKFRLVHILCVSINGAYFLLYFLGLYSGGWQPGSLIWCLFYLLFPVINIWGLTSTSTAINYRVTIFNLICILLFVITLIGAETSDARLWVGVVIGIAIMNIIGLSIQKGDSWLSLYVERKQLEERRKIEALRKALDESNDLNRG